MSFYGADGFQLCVVYADATKEERYCCEQWQSGSCGGEHWYLLADLHLMSSRALFRTSRTLGVHILSHGMALVV
jgi:hypothetical protein